MIWVKLRNTKWVMRSMPKERVPLGSSRKTCKRRTLTSWKRAKTRSPMISRRKNPNRFQLVKGVSSLLARGGALSNSVEKFPSWHLGSGWASNWMNPLGTQMDRSRGLNISKQRMGLPSLECSCDPRMSKWVSSPPWMTSTRTKMKFEQFTPPHTSACSCSSTPHRTSASSSALTCSTQAENSHLFSSQRGPPSGSNWDLFGAPPG